MNVCIGFLNLLPDILHFEFTATSHFPCTRVNQKVLRQIEKKLYLLKLQNYFST